MSEESIESTKDLTADEKLDKILIELADLREWRVGLDARLTAIENDAKARYVDLRAHLTRVQASFDILNNKFDAQVDEVKFLRKSVRTFEDKIDKVTV